MKKQYKKLGALFRAPVIESLNTLVVTLAVIGMVTYVGLYNPRASLAMAKPVVAEARAAPASKPGDLNGDEMVNARDLALHLSSYDIDNAVFEDRPSIKTLALEAEMAIIMQYASQ